MFAIQTLNSISAKGLQKLPSSLFCVEDDAENPSGILLRSANMHEMELPESLLAVGRAGAGVNNIPLERCSEQGIVVFNTPGANANAVKELVLAAMVLSGRNIVGGINWLQTLAGEGDKVPSLVEKGKGKFTGPELEGKTLGVVGLGAIGARVANMGVALGMEVLGYDPFISVEGAWSLSRSVIHCFNLSDIIAKCDYISLHLPVNADTKHFLNAEVIAQMKQGARIMNFARGELVDNVAMVAALKNGRLGAYATDFPTADLVGQPGVLCIPHLGASTPESEENCAVMAAKQLREYLLNGNIINSVNLPNVTQPRAGACRVCVIHKNIKGMLAGVTSGLNNAGINIENLINKSRGDYAYTMLDVASVPDESVVQQLLAIDGVIRVRAI